VTCHLCEGGTCCPVHEPELYAARLADAFEAYIVSHAETCGWCGEFGGDHSGCL
jgi:hypothetical protein